MKYVRTQIKIASDPRVLSGFFTMIGAVYIIVMAPANSDLRGAYIGAAVALVAVGLPQGVNAVYERTREIENQMERERAALDETRRVCLMALSVGTAGEAHREIIATAVNALTYHAHVVDSSSAANLLAQLYSGGTEDIRIIMERFVDRLCRMRGDEPMFGRQP